MDIIRTLIGPDDGYLERNFLEVNRLIYSEAQRFPELAVAATQRNDLGISQLSEFIRSRAELDGVPCKDPDTVAEVLIFLMRGWYLSAMLSDREVPAKTRQDWVDRSIRTLLCSRAEW